MLWHLCMTTVLTNRPAPYISTGHARLGLATICGGTLELIVWQQVCLLRLAAQSITCACRNPTCSGASTCPPAARICLQGRYTLAQPGRTAIPWKFRCNLVRKWKLNIIYILRPGWVVAPQRHEGRVPAHASTGDLARRRPRTPPGLSNGREGERGREEGWLIRKRPWNQGADGEAEHSAQGHEHV